MKKPTQATRELVKICCRALEEKLAEDVRVLDVSAQSSITDYMILATGTSDPHLRALRVELARALAAANTRLVGVETAQESGWTVVDLFDVMVHLFTAEKRDLYRLENLWKDADDVSVSKLLAIPRAKKAKPAGKPAKKPAKRRAS